MKQTYGLAVLAVVFSVLVARIVSISQDIVLPKITEARSQIQAAFDRSVEIIEARGNVTSAELRKARLKPASNSYVDAQFPSRQKQIENIERENATILMLCRNWELPGVLSSMRSLEDHFNRDYHYTWTFLNDVEFTSEFKEATTAMASGETQYGLVPAEDWNTPKFINQTKYDECVEDFVKREIIYGHSKSYRNMCHFNSGFFFRQPLVMQYDYYFRVEPDVQYFCDFQMDPFRLMREQKQKYGFVISILEYPETIPTLWSTVEDFMHKFPEDMHKDNAADFITTNEMIGPEMITADTKDAYNMCHFWSNFEIGDLKFFRSKAYMDYFNYLSASGGFYYERWGDAPVHSIAASLLLDKDEIFHFEDVGYNHVPFFTYPEAHNMKVGKRCVFPQGEDAIDVEPSSCLPRWWKHGGGKKFLREYFHEEEYV